LRAYATDIPSAQREQSWHLQQAIMGDWKMVKNGHVMLLVMIEFAHPHSKANCKVLTHGVI